MPPLSCNREPGPEDRVGYRVGQEQARPGLPSLLWLSCGLYITAYLTRSGGGAARPTGLSSYRQTHTALSEEGAIAKQQQAFTRINESIRVPQVRLIDAEGNQAGVVETVQAKQMAEEAELDLVEVAPEARPPVCRIMDYGKYRYDREKKAKEARKKQHNVQMKTVRIKTANISEHDMAYRLGHIREFIGKGNRVKVSMRFFGRQMAYKDRGRAVMDSVAGKVDDIAAIDQEPRMEGREMSMILRPL